MIIASVKQRTSVGMVVFHAVQPTPCAYAAQYTMKLREKEVVLFNAIKNTTSVEILQATN